MIKMIKTIVKAVFYLLFISFLMVLMVYLVKDLITYYTVPDSPMPLIMVAVRWIMNVPILGSLIGAVLTVMT